MNEVDADLHDQTVNTSIALMKRMGLAIQHCKKLVKGLIEFKEEDN
jgi:hypothetical protein